MLLLLVVALPGFAADWREELTPPQPGKFPPPRPQAAIYRFGWGAFSAAEAEFDFHRTKKNQLQLDVTAKTIGAVRALWQMDAKHTARCAAATLRPISLQQTETYRKETEKTKADFSAEGVVRLQESDPPPKTPPRPKRFKFPDLFDLQTALLFVRSQSLEAGETLCFVVYPAKAAYLARVSVVGREPIEVHGQSYPAVKLQLGLQQVSKDLVLVPHSKFTNAYAWLSDDKDRLLLKVQADLFVGSVWAELQSVKFGRE
ncbi:MAG: hypothetical protein QOE70_6045 [Chthoniobacter sp.]|nr:hypothetical protein [Chthoniobacter sp.]